VRKDAASTRRIDRDIDFDRVLVELMKDAESAIAFARQHKSSRRNPTKACAASSVATSDSRRQHATLSSREDGGARLRTAGAGLRSLKPVIGTSNVDRIK
jgi:hypothetical protein